jgi:hypothetical protein
MFATILKWKFEKSWYMFMVYSELPLARLPFMSANGATSIMENPEFFRI